MKDRVIKNDGKLRMIYTLPRSGTWYHKIFLNAYKRFLNGNPDGNIHSGEAIHMEDTIGLNFFVTHGPSPVYDMNPEVIPQWDKISYCTEGYNLSNNIHYSHTDIFDNFNLPFVYLYRNPLDHAVSMYWHAQNHVRPDIRQLIQGESVASSGKKYFIPSMIKQYMTFGSHPRCLKVQYADMVKNPRKHFISLLRHCGHSYILDALEYAIKISDINHVKSIESKMVRSIGGDLIKGNHARDGGVEQWKKYFTHKDLDEIEKFMQTFRLSLHDFNILLHQ